MNWVNGNLGVCAGDRRHKASQLSDIWHRSEYHSSDSVKQVGWDSPRGVSLGWIVVAYLTLSKLMNLKATQFLRGVIYKLFQKVGQTESFSEQKKDPNLQNNMLLESWRARWNLSKTTAFLSLLKSRSESPGKWLSWGNIIFVLWTNQAFI